MDTKCLLCTNADSLYLEYNGIASDGLLALARAFRTNTRLLRIHLWGNAWDAAACSAFSQLVGSDTRILPNQIDCRFYCVEDEWQVARAPAVQTPGTLRSI